ncbi:MAG: hypothetical protein HYT21_02200 [Candidatus Nealsonbacteria bacterium]|nr:hypothetical protein [Candidatus Nealsonbacteria bacterium]
MRVHFIGIGGIGVSALAQYYLAKGHDVSGCDLVRSEITDALKKKGAKITIGKNTARKDANLTIYSPAVPQNGRERFSTAMMGYPQALGKLTKEYFTIAVAGTHGKSTTTAMLSLILTKAGLNPFVIIGTKLKEFGNTNFRAGGKPIRNFAKTLLCGKNVLVIEADEHFASFLHYWPQIIVITNIEADHLDYYKNLKNVQNAFDKFIKHLPGEGKLIDLRNQSKLMGFVNQSIDVEKLRKILKVPGEHNILNALAALTAARALKIPDKVSFKALSEYRGAWRRFEVKKAKAGNVDFTLVSDYGHHPTEVKVTLNAMEEKWPKNKIWCIFQPHQYQRTHYLFNDFVKTFREASIDRIIITDIYDVAGRENKKFKNTVSSEKLVRKINSPKIIYLPKNDILGYLSKNLPNKTILAVMGAGDIYGLTKEFSYGM